MSKWHRLCIFMTIVAYLWWRWPVVKIQLEWFTKKVAFFSTELLRGPYDYQYLCLYVYIFQFTCSVVSDSLRHHELKHARPPRPSRTIEVHSDSRPSSRWCHPFISSSVILFSSRLQSFPESASFPMGQFFISGGQSIGVSASASVLPMNIQDWLPLGLTSLISLQSKGLSRVFSNTAI